MRAAVVCTYPPRRCGLASYAQDLSQALARDMELVICALDRHGHAYPDDVVVVIDQDDPEDYLRAARVIAEHAVDVVLIQHEYGIFGGERGEHVLALTRELRRRGISYLVTLHTVLPEPDDAAMRVIGELTAGADTVTVFTHAARRVVVTHQLAEPDRVVVVPHGVPTVIRAASRLRAGSTLGAPRHRVRQQLSELLAELRDARVLSTFGLIGPGKGVETAISALPAVLAAHPEAHYVIAGCTHPEVARGEGERYRDSLQDLAASLGVADHVHFVDAYLTTGELSVLLGRTDVYLTPYRCREQSRSGTLTYALAAGCPVVSTDFHYAETMLGTGAGVVVPCGDHDAFGTAVIELLGDPRRMAQARLAADRLGSQVVWPAVAARHSALAKRAVAGPAARVGRELDVPPLRLDQLRSLVDEIGVIRASRGRRPDFAAGYRLDDVSRLAIVATRLLNLPASVLPPMTWTVATEWIISALQFTEAALGRDGLRNQRAHSGVWRDEPQLGDHVGRALWGVGVVAAGPNMPILLRDRARTLRAKLTDLAGRVSGLHASAYTILGLAHDEQLTGAERAELAAAAGRLDEAWHRGGDQWRWFAERLGADDARLPQAMIAAGHRLGDPALGRRGVQALDWYARQVGLATGDGVLRPVTNPWRGPTGEHPTDVAATVEALVEAYLATETSHYGRLARRAYTWFLGMNRFDVPIYDPDTGTCQDGIAAVAVNASQSAESVLAYHQAMLSLVEADLAQLPVVDPLAAVSFSHAGHPQPVPGMAR